MYIVMGYVVSILSGEAQFTIVSDTVSYVIQNCCNVFDACGVMSRAHKHGLQWDVPARAYSRLRPDLRLPMANCLRSNRNRSFAQRRMILFSLSHMCRLIQRAVADQPPKAHSLREADDLRAGSEMSFANLFGSTADTDVTTQPVTCPDLDGPQSHGVASEILCTD